MTDVINNKIFVSNLRILYRKYLQKYVFLYGHGNYEKIRKTCDIIICRDYGPLKENNSNKEI